jgi:hypothetical protein
MPRILGKRLSASSRFWRYPDRIPFWATTSLFKVHLAEQT